MDETKSAPYWIETPTGRWTPAGLRAIPTGDVEIRQPVASLPNRAVLVSGKVVGTIRRYGPLWVVAINGHEFHTSEGGIASGMGVKYTRPKGCKTLREAKTAALAVLSSRPIV